MLQVVRGSIPPKPKGNCYLKIDEYGELYWHCVEPNRKLHLALAAVFNVGTWAFFAWVLWHSLP
jgi:hypothetical protein